MSAGSARAAAPAVGRGSPGLRWAAVAAAALFLAGLIPLLWAGFYAHPFGDDYAFGVFLHDALSSGSSPLGALWYTRHKLGQSSRRT